jgi:protein-arginine kinase activator protein McsA
MICDKCHQREATIAYTTPNTPPDAPMLQVCEHCLKEISPKAFNEIQKAKDGEKPSKGWTFYNPTSN